MFIAPFHIDEGENEKPLMKRKWYDLLMRYFRQNPYLSAPGPKGGRMVTFDHYIVIAKYLTSERKVIKNFELDYFGNEAYSDTRGEYTYTYFEYIPNIKAATELISALETLTGRNQLLAIESIELKKSYLELRADSYDKKELSEGRAVYGSGGGGSLTFNEDHVVWYDEGTPEVLEAEETLDRWENRGYKGAKKVLGDLWRGPRSSSEEARKEQAYRDRIRSRKARRDEERSRPWNQLKRFVGIGRYRH